MRKKKNKSKRNTTIMGIIIIIIMISSLLGIINQSTNNSQKHNGIKFKQSQNGWIAKINGQYREFIYSPDQLENISIDKSFIESIKSSKTFYITFNPEIQNKQIVDKIRFDIIQNLDSYVILQGVTKQDNNYELSTVSCENATEFMPVIYLNEAKNYSINYENNCLKINAVNNYDFLIFRDKLLYLLFDIQEE